MLRLPTHALCKIVDADTLAAPPNGIGTRYVIGDRQAQSAKAQDGWLISEIRVLGQTQLLLLHIFAGIARCWRGAGWRWARAALAREESHPALNAVQLRRFGFRASLSPLNFSKD